MHTYQRRGHTHTHRDPNVFGKHFYNFVQGHCMQFQSYLAMLVQRHSRNVHFSHHTPCVRKGRNRSRANPPFQTTQQGYSSLFRMSTTRSFGLLDFVFLVGVLKWPVTESSHKSIKSSAEIRGDTSDFRSFKVMDSLD